MKWRSRFTPPLRALGGLLLLSLLAACGLFALPQEPGALIFKDSFTSSSSGWHRVHGEGYLADYSDYNGGAFIISLSQPQAELWSLAELRLADVDLEVMTEKLGGPDDNAFGLICRYQDPANYLFFLISSDGYAGIGQVQDGQRVLLSGATMLPNPAIQRGAALNRLRAICQGPALKLFVNGTLILESRTQALAAGDVGLLALSYDQAGVLIAFDDLVVRNP